MGDVLRTDIEGKIQALPGVEGGGRAGRARSAVGPEQMSDAARLQLGLM